MKFSSSRKLLEGFKKRESLPEILREYEIPSTVYSVSITLRLMITRTYETGIISCNCSNSEYLNHHHGHVITWNLQIIENEKLRKIISKGPNHRESRTINGKISRKENNTEGLDNLIKGKLMSEASIIA